MRRGPQRSKLAETLFPYTTLFRSHDRQIWASPDSRPQIRARCRNAHAALGIERRRAGAIPGLGVEVSKSRQAAFFERGTERDGQGAPVTVRRTVERDRAIAAIGRAHV